MPFPDQLRAVVLLVPGAGVEEGTCELCVPPNMADGCPGGKGNGRGVGDQLRGVASCDKPKPDALKPSLKAFGEVTLARLVEAVAAPLLKEAIESGLSASAVDIPCVLKGVLLGVQEQSMLS